MTVLTRALALAMLLSLGLAACATPGDAPPPTPSRLVAEKRADVQRLDAVAGSRADFGSYRSPKLRAATERDSGRGETLMFLRDVNFRFFGDIGFYTPRLIVSARAKDRTKPVVFDDPQSFEFAVLRGGVTVPPTALGALINRHTFNFEGAPLRKVRAATREGALVLVGEMNRRGKWVPFEMEGPVTLANETTLAYTPNRTTIDGEPADALLAAANVELDELITLNAPGLRLTKSTVYLDATAIFPPPRMRLSIRSVAATPAGLELTVDSAQAPPFVEPPRKSASYILIRGGDVKFLTVMLVDALMQIEAKEQGGKLDFSLYHYRKQLAAGDFKFRPDGALFVRFKNAPELGLGEAMH